eukprot:SAG31_NODE_488_length_14964_cov_56.443458_5_plen_100_part_00
MLPQFNTNAIEQWLWRLPGLTAETFVHMNDDYIFTAPIEPQDLLGPSCTGIRQLLEKGKIKVRGYFLVFVQLFEKYGTLFERWTALIEKVSASIASECG